MVGGALYLIIKPTGADLPAQLLRTQLFGAEGFGIWNNWWYGGHYLLSYSVLFPPLAWLTSPQLVAAVAVVLTAAAFEAIVHDVFGEDAWVGATWLGAATVVELLSGRLTFALGLYGAALTALALQRRHAWIGAGTGALTALASPVAALFAALAGATVLIASAPPQTARVRHPRDLVQARWDGLAVAIATLAPTAVLAVAFPQAGSQPFTFATLWPLLAVGSALLAAGAGVSRSADRMLRTGVVLYLAGCLAAYLIPTEVGANAARLGELIAGPLAALILVKRRALLLLAVVAIPLTYMQIHDAVTDLQYANRSPADTAGYYRPLIRFLSAQPGAAAHLFRVEVPFTRGHWESYRLAPFFPLARGWERQLDIADNHLFYAGRLTAATYEAWLHQLAVRYVALPDAPLDYSARAEVKLIDAGLPYLRPVARLSHWRVYRVVGTTTVASGVATLRTMRLNSLTLAVRRPGATYIRVRWSSYWQLRGVRGCVAPAGAFTRISARSSGIARLTIGFALDRFGSRTPRCN